jgi:hypothetical protein
MVTSSNGLGILLCAFIELREKSLIESKSYDDAKEKSGRKPR